MNDSPLELVVVTSFGDGVDHYRALLPRDDVRVVQAREHAGLIDRIGDRRDSILAVLVDRWLRDDSAAACLEVAGAAGVPVWLMVPPNSPLADDPASSVSFGRIEKPLTREELLKICADAEAERAAADAAPIEDLIEEDPIAVLAPEPPAEPEPQPELVSEPEPLPEEPCEPAAEPVAEAAEAEPAAATDSGAGAARLLDEVRETLRKLSDVIQYDSLSGLLHRDFFLERAVHEERQARRYGLPIGAMMIDVDDFKSINDTHGHDAGNAVLQAIGDVIHRTVRDDLDFASRLYGDEFAVLLPATPVHGAVRLGERLLQAIAECEDPCRFSVSIGCHALNPEELADDGIRTLLEGADQALLESKRRGKGQVTPLHPIVLVPQPEEAPIAPPMPAPSPAPPQPVAVDRQEDPLAVEIADAAGGLAEDAELAASGDLGKVLLVNADREVGDIVVDFMAERGIAVDVVPDLASALTELDTLEYFLVLVDGHPAQPEVRAFIEAVERIDAAIYAFLLADRAAAAEHASGRGEAPQGSDRMQVVAKPFLLSELYVRASRAREMYHLDRTSTSGQSVSGQNGASGPNGSSDGGA